MEIPGLGVVTKDLEFGRYYSQPMAVANRSSDAAHTVTRAFTFRLSVAATAVSIAQPTDHKSLLPIVDRQDQP